MLFNLRLIGALTSKPYAFSARSWELESLSFVDFYDSLLSNISVDIRGLNIMRILPRINENLNEEWISDKIRFSYDGFRRQRLVNPMVKIFDSEKNQLVFINISWEESLFCFFFNFNLKNYDYLDENKFFSVLGEFIDLESLNFYRLFLNSFSNSLVKIVHNKFFYNISSYFLDNFLLNESIKNLSNVDFFFLMCTNVRYDLPVLHVKFLRFSNKGLPFFTFGNYSKVKYKSYSLGYSLNGLYSLLKGKNKYSLIIKKFKNPLFLVGEDFFKRSQDLHSFKLLNIFKSLNIKLGFLVSNISNLASLFLGIPFEKIESNKIYNNFFLYNYNSDNLFFKFSSKNYLVYHGHHGDTGALNSNLIFPSTLLLEKKGSFFNVEGNIVEFDFLIKPALNIRTDWRIFKALTLYFKNDIFNNLNDFFFLKKLLIKYIPFKVSNLLSNNNININIENFLENYCFRFYNNSFNIIYNNYYLTDQITRSSRIMALTYSKFKEKYYNF